MQKLMQSEAPAADIATAASSLLRRWSSHARALTCRHGFCAPAQPGSGIFGGPFVFRVRDNEHSRGGPVRATRIQALEPPERYWPNKPPSASCCSLPVVQYFPDDRP